ncbi:MAG: TetR/AcrR family transcriptional regulator [Catenulispora sp.]
MTTTDESATTIDQETEQVRQLILDAAAASFLKRGFPDSSMSDIFEASGVDPETAYALFPRKHDLIEALCRFNKAAGGRMMADLAEESPAPATAELIVRVMEFWESQAADGGRAGLVPQALGLSLFDKEIDTIMQDVVAVQKKRWTALAERMQREGRLREGANVDDVGTTLLTMSIGFTVYHMMGGVDSGIARRGLLDLIVDR